MKLKRTGGSLAAAVAMLSLSGAAIADHEAVCAAGLSDMIKQSAAELACNDGATFDTLGYSGLWPTANPLWQFRGGKLKNASEADRDAAGCEVHAKLATKLYAIRPDDGSPPPRNKKNSNDTRGAANALDPANLKFETAVAALESFRDSIDASVANPDSSSFPALPDGSNPTPSQTEWAQFLKDWADSTIYSVKVCGHLDL